MRVIRNRIILALVLIVIVVLIIILANSCHKKHAGTDSQTRDGITDMSGSGQGDNSSDSSGKAGAGNGSQTGYDDPAVRLIAGTNLSYNDLNIQDSDTVTSSGGTAYVRSAVEISDEDISPSDDTDYIIRVNLAQEVTTVYRLDASGKEVPVKAFACSTARGAHETPDGEYYLDEWYKWCFLADGTYGQYAYRLIQGDITDIMFHSVPYLEMSKDSLEWGDYDKLGSPASLGCIRMNVADVRWIAKNVGPGVDVIVYSDASDPGPLGKPESFFVPWDAGTLSGWDPSDPDPDNPWHDYDMTLTAEDQITIPASSETFDITKYIRATDNHGNDLSRYATYTFSGRQYGFNYEIIDPEDVDSYPDYDQSDLVSYGYTGMDVSIPGTYDIVICIKSGPIKAYRSMQVIVQ